MRDNPAFDTMKLGAEMWWLGMEAATVIAMRSIMLASGGAAARRESQRMVSEKVAAAIELQTAAMTGKLGTEPVAAARRTVAMYTGKVRRNRKRLG